MCGIVGVWWPPEISPDPAVLQRALELIRHRGPDGQGELTADGVSLAMRRLSIVDLAGGGQPRFDETRQIAVVCNGEIYNAPELANELVARGHTLLGTSDVEPIPHLWEEHGLDAIRRLRGMFALALFDRRARKLVLARDRFGKKPLYWFRSANGGLAFASELKGLRPLAEGLGFPLRLRSQAIYDYLSLGVVPQPDTVWEGVQCVPPASWLSFDGTRVEVSRYWDLARTPKLRLSAREAAEAVREKVAEAVRIRLRADVTVGTFLSGGIDSGVVTYEAARSHGPGLTAYTVAFRGEPAWDESADAAASARHIGVRHELLPLEVAPRELVEEVVRHWDQPFADPSAIPSLAVSRLARERVTVILNGDGGDELFAGYRRYLAALGGRVLAHVPAGVAGSLAGWLGGQERRSTLGFLARWLRGAGTSPAERYLTWTTDLLLEPAKRAAWIGPACRPTEEWLASQLPTLDGLDDWLDADRRINLLSDLLVKMDMATMAASLEGRSPLLDHELAELTARLPARTLLAGGRLKGILRRAYAHALPVQVLRGKKRGFEVPLARWLDGDLRALAQDALGDPAARLREYLSPELIARGLDPSTRPFQRYALLVLELWLRRRDEA